MQAITLSRMTNAGWSNERDIDIESIEKVYSNRNIYMPENIRIFFRKYGMLMVKFTKLIQNVEVEEVIKFDPIEAIGINLDGDYFKELLDEYDVDEIVYPIGISNRGNLIMLMTEKGAFYRCTDGFLCKDGDSIDEMLDCVVGECREPVFIE